jgi:predicted transposase YbfD/YdcC
MIVVLKPVIQKRCVMNRTILSTLLDLPNQPLLLSLDAVYAAFQSLSDQRDRRGVRYPLAALLLVALLAKLAGAQSLRAVAEWAQLRADELCPLVGLTRLTMPHPATWSRIFGWAVDPQRLNQAIRQVFSPPSSEVPARGTVALAIDGKTLRGTIPYGPSQGVHLLAAYLPERGVVLLQVAVENKANELTVAPRLLAQVDLHGVLVTGDAMFTQRELSIQIVEAGGDYLWPIKDNQPQLREEVELLFAPEEVGAGCSAVPLEMRAAKQVDKGHGRIEERLLVASTELQEYSRWPYLAQVFKYQVVTTVGEATTTTVRYGVTSLPPSVADAARLLELARQHWLIETGLHYRRDVTLGEDASLVRRGRAPEVLASLNNTVLGLFARLGWRNAASALRTTAFQIERALANLSLQCTL